MKYRVAHLIIFVSLIALWLNSCDDDEAINIIPAPEYYLKLSIDRVEVDTIGGQSVIDIQANCSWSISSKPNWVSFSKMSGTGDDRLEYGWTDNYGPESRRSEVVFSYDINKKRSFIITQEGTGYGTAPILLSSHGVVGNEAVGETGYFEMTFDQPVTIENYSIDRWLISSDPIYEDNRRTIKQPFPGAQLGLDLSGKVIVTNRKGLITTIDVNIPFYQRKISTEGSFGYALLTDDEQRLWISHSGPNKLMEISLESGETLQEVEMPFAPRNICYNPYNQKLYALPSGRVNYLCIIDPVSGIVEDTISFSPRPRDHPQYPYIYPYELQFTNDGFGVILLHDTNGYCLWRYIDSADGNKQSLNDSYYQICRLEHVYRSYDGTRIWANPYYQLYSPMYYISRDNPRPSVFNVDGKFRSNEYYAGGNMMDLQFSRLKNKMFICTAPGSQCVIDIDKNTYSDVTIAEGRDSKSAWDYTDSNRSWVYLVCALNQYFLLIDMDHADWIFAGKHIWYDTPLNVYHLPKSNQVVVVSSRSICWLDASQFNGSYPE